MIKLRAVAFNDGWAFFSEGDEIFQLRPPYDEKIPASEHDIEIAVNKHDFEARDGTEIFESLDQAIVFLEEKYVRSKVGTGIPTSEELREVLKFAAADTLKELLDRIESELMPAGSFDAALALAEDIMKVTIDEEILERAKGISDICRGTN